MEQEMSIGCESSTETLLSKQRFRFLVVVLGIWFMVGSGYLYRQELAMRMGLWDSFALNGINYSRFIDARDSEEIFQGSLLSVSQAHRLGALFVGPYTLYSRQVIPFDNKESYLMSFDLMAISDGTNDQGSAIYAGVVFFDENMHIIMNPQAAMYGVAWNQHVTRTMGVVTLSGIFSPTASALSRVPSGARYMKIAIDLNYADSRASVIVSNINFKRVANVLSGDNK